MNQNIARVTSFITDREAELAEMEKTTQDGLSHVRTAPSVEGYRMDTEPGPFRHPDYASMPGTVIPANDPSFRFTDRIPTLDDFALALIQGMGQDAIIHHPETLYDLAVAYKAESDRRRGI